MTQHSYNIANQNGASFRADLNAALQAIATNNLGATAPATTYPGMWWLDTTANVFKQRNVADTAWVSKMTLAFAMSAYGESLASAADAPAARTLLSVAPRATRIDVASASTVDLTTSAPDTDDIRITGTTTITAVTVAAGRDISVTASAAHTLTNNANIVTQTGANIVCAAGDTYVLRATAANVVEVMFSTAKRTGTWTPTIQGSTGLTHGAQLGTWTRLGNQVTVTMSVGVGALGAMDGFLSVSGLPFASTGSSHWGLVRRNVSFSNYDHLIFAAGGGTVLYPYYMTGSAGIPIPTTVLHEDFYLDGTVIYETNAA